MSDIRPLRMEHLFRCTVCDRLVDVVLVLGHSPVRALEKKGACVVGPNQQGLLLVEGCGGCLRYTSKPRPNVQDNGGG